MVTFPGSESSHSAIASVGVRIPCCHRHQPCVHFQDCWLDAVVWPGGNAGAAGVISMGTRTGCPFTQGLLKYCRPSIDCVVNLSRQFALARWFQLSFGGCRTIGSTISSTAAVSNNVALIHYENSEIGSLETKILASLK